MFTLRRCSNLFASLMIGALLAVAFAGAAPAVQKPVSALTPTFYVKPTGLDTNTCKTPALACKTINAAITKAGAGATIKVTVGTYTATTGAEVVLINKRLTLQGGWNITFTAQTGRSVIDGKKLRRGVTLTSATNTTNPVTVDHFLIQNGHANPGGGINNAGNLILSNSIVTHNWTPVGYGAGIWSSGTRLTVNASTISYNTGGEGIRASGGLIINNSAINYNTGGGVRAGNPAISNSTLDHNSPVAIGGGDLTMTGSTVSNTTGRGISSTGTVTITNSTMSGTVGNATYPDGSGIESQYSLKLSSSTVTNNYTGVRISGGSGWVANTIMAGNSSDGGVTPNDCVGTFMSFGYNLIGSTDSCTFPLNTGDLTGTNLARIDAKLGPLQDNGGPAFTHALLAGSPAIDAGNPMTPQAPAFPFCLATDQRGYVHPSGGCDIGADEYYPLGVYAITRLDGDPTSAGTVRFDVNFSVAVTGVDATDFVLTTTGTVTAPAITSVTGSGASYTVTVSTGSGDGTLRLDLVDDDSILDAHIGEPIGGVGTGNGDFTTGEAYTIVNPSAVSVNRAAATPTLAATVTFTVTFSTPVTGVNKVAPFSDFAVTAAGLTGAKVTAVTGVGKTYMVTVNRGVGAGTVRLDIVDDDTIIDPTSGRPLGGTGTGNGDFTAGQFYDIVPMPQTPVVKTFDPTPTFTWTRLAGVTQYQYQLLLNGTTPIYTKTAPSTVCTTTTCSSTPTTQLDPGQYIWKVQAYSNGVWSAYSPTKYFVEKAPLAGHWGTPSDWISFYVAPSSARVLKFTLYVYSSTCKKGFAITHLAPVNVSSAGKFTFTGPVYANGNFEDLNDYDAAVSAWGTAGLNNYPLPGCGTLTGWANWSTVWTDSSQPAVAAMQPGMNLFVMPQPDAPFHLYVPWVTNP